MTLRLTSHCMTNVDLRTSFTLSSIEVSCITILGCINFTYISRVGDFSVRKFTGNFSVSRLYITFYVSCVCFTQV